MIAKALYMRFGLFVTVTTLVTIVASVDAQMTAPNPYRVVPGTWAPLPDGREWGATSAVYPTPDGMGIWVAERCGANLCVGSDVDPVLLYDLDGKLHPCAPVTCRTKRATARPLQPRSGTASSNA